MGHMTVSNCFLQKYLKFNFAFCQQSYLMRGGIKIEKRENFGHVPIGGGRGKKTEMSQFQFGNLENRGGGVSIFQKCPNFHYLIV